MKQPTYSTRGIATPSDLDVALKNSLGIRWSVVGPLGALIQTTPGGFATTLAFVKPSFQDIADIPTLDYTGEEAKAAAAKVAEDFGKTASPESLAHRDEYLERVAEALEGR